MQSGGCGDGGPGQAGYLDQLTRKVQLSTTGPASVYKVKSDYGRCQMSMSVLLTCMHTHICTYTPYTYYSHMYIHIYNSI